MANTLLRTFTNLFRPQKTADGWWYRFYSSKSETYKQLDYLLAFEEIPEVNSVIGKLADFTSNGIFKVVNEKLEEQTEHPVNRLLKNPNWFQAQKEFIQQTTIFHAIYGNEYVFSLTPFGFNFSPDKVKAIYTLPPNLIKAKYKSDVPFFMHDKVPDALKYYYKKENGKYEEISASSIIHLNDNRVCIDKVNDEQMYQGSSRLKSLAPVINNIRMAYESRGMILKSRGANGAWVPEAAKDVVGPIALTPNEHKDLQDQFKMNYGTLDGQSQFIVSNRPMKFVQAGLNEPEKLGLYKETQEGFYKIIDSYGLHPDVFSNEKGATFENQRQAEKGVYIRTVIPNSNEWAMAFNQKFLPDGKLKVIADYSHLPFFQEDLKLKADALNTIINALSRAFQDSAITIEEYKNELIKYGLMQ